MTSLPSLVLLPSLLSDEEVWRGPMQTVQDRATCQVIDTTHHDRIETLAQDVVRNAPARFALAGISMGGYVAFEILRIAPERVTKLCLISTSARADTPEQNERRRLLLAMSKAGQFKGVTPRLLPLLIAPERVTDQPLTDAIMNMAARVGRTAFQHQQAAILHRVDSRPFLKKIRCPTLVIGGEQDQITPPDCLQEIAAGIPNARLEMIPACGHLAPMEQPETVGQLMRAWLEEGPPSAQA